MAAGDTQLNANLFLVPGADSLLRSSANLRIAVFEQEDKQLQQLSGGMGAIPPAISIRVCFGAVPASRDCFRLL